MLLLEALKRSAAAPEFHESVEAFLASGKPTERIIFGRNAPPIKIERTLIKLLLTYPGLVIEQVNIEGRSGCEFFRGVMLVRTTSEEVRIEFDWDCKWRALELGWKDFFGFPDQARAAREFGYDCFRIWNLVGQLTEV